MADTVITPTTISTIEDTSAARSQIPAYHTGSYANDALYHTLTFAASGKGRFAYCIDNKSSVATVCTLYGSFSEDGEVGDANVFAIDDTGITAGAVGKAYDTCSDPFGYYILRCKAATAGDAKLISLFVALMAY